MLKQKFGDDHDKIVDAMVKFADGVLQDVVSDVLKGDAEYRNSNGVLAMDREIVSVQGGFWTGKKRYAVYVDDMEGVRYPKDKPKKKIMGLEVSRTSQYPAGVRKIFTDAIDLIIREKDESKFHTFVKEKKKEFMQAHVEDIAFRVKMSEFEHRKTKDGWTTGTGAAHKSAWAHNDFLKKQGLDGIIEPIKPGDGIYWVYLRQPNKWGYESFGFVEWNEHYEPIVKYIDRNVMWEKVVFTPLKRYAEAVGWEAEQKAFKLFGKI